MASYKAKPQIDPLVRAQIETQKRAARAAERRGRFLNAKQRILGIDSQFLDQQAGEARSRVEEEKQRDAMWDDLTVYHANQIKEMDRAKIANARAQNVSVEKYRLQQIQERDAARRAAQDQFDAFGEVQTNFLNFQGEDLDRDARTKAMQIQQQDWLAQQISELGERESFDREQTADYDSKQAELNALMKADEQEMHAELKNRRIQLQYENRALAEAKREREARDKNMNESLNQWELTNQLKSAYLNESTSRNVGGRAGFKGFTQEQLQAVLDEQEYQRQELAARRAAEAQASKEYDDKAEDIRRMMIIAERQKETNRKQALASLRAERQTQALEKTERYQYLDTVMFENPIRQEYFEQFGTSDR